MRSSLLITVAMIAACSHSEPTSAGDYGADSPLVTFPFPVLARGVSDPSWSTTSESVYVSFPFRAVAPDGRAARWHDLCLGTIPVTGGSIRRPLCDHRDGFITYLRSAAVDASGRWLYTQSNEPDRHGHPFPVGWTFDLWLGEPRLPTTDRVKLYTLYRDDVGRPTVPPETVNWLSNLTWGPGDTFFAMGYHLFPSKVLAVRGVVRGVIRDGTATLSVLPNTSTAVSFSITRGAADIMVLHNNLGVSHINVASTAATTFQPLPASVPQPPIAIGCRHELCILTVQAAGRPTAEAWTWTIGDASATFHSALPESTTAVMPSPDGRRMFVLAKGVLDVRPLTTSSLE